MVVVVIVVLITFAERGARKVDMPRVPASDTKSLTGRGRGGREREREAEHLCDEPRSAPTNAVTPIVLLQFFRICT